MSSIHLPYILMGLVITLALILSIFTQNPYLSINSPYSSMLNNSPLTISNKKLHYSSDLTRNILVKKIHSHNDYWRDIPLLTALSHGVQSVEADVWYFPEGSDDTIYVGHSLASLTPDRTLNSLYIDPIIEILKTTNPVNKFTKYSKHSNGVFDTDSYATLYLFIDFKTDGDRLWDRVYAALEPLRSLGYLTTFDESSGDWHKGPVTVIGTGNTPFHKVARLSKRDFFFDAPLNNLNSSFLESTNPIASGSLLDIVGAIDEIAGLSDKQYDTLKSFVDDAHDKGIMTRVWDTPWWPVQKKINVWRQLLKMGSDFLNADDIAYASSFY